MNLRPLIAALGLSLLAGCATPRYDHTDIEDVVRPSGGELSDERLYLPVGSVLTARITSYDENDDVMDTDVLVEDSSILEVHPVFGNSSFAFLGVKPGSTKVSLLADGQVVRTYVGTVVVVQ